MHKEIGIKYYKGRYSIAFYKDTEDKTDERLVAIFDNPGEICRYKKMNLSENSLTQIKVELYNALKRTPPTTRMLNGSTMKVYLIDMLEEQEEQERRDKCMTTKKFVKISSSIDIEVYGNLDAFKVVDSSNKLTNAKQGWANMKVMFTRGANWYPSEVLEWESVKKLVMKELFVIGEEANEIANVEQKEKAEKDLASILKAKRNYEKEKEKFVKTEAKN